MLNAKNSCNSTLVNELHWRRSLPDYLNRFTTIDWKSFEVTRMVTRQARNQSQKRMAKPTLPPFKMPSKWLEVPKMSRIRAVESLQREMLMSHGQQLSSLPSRAYHTFG